MVMRFASVTIISLAVRGLVTVIKYSQATMAGNLGRPVEIMVAAAIPLTGLGIFLPLTRKDGKRERAFRFRNAGGHSNSQHRPD